MGLEFRVDLENPPLILLLRVPSWQVGGHFGLLLGNLPLNSCANNSTTLMRVNKRSGNGEAEEDKGSRQDKTVPIGEGAGMWTREGN